MAITTSMIKELRDTTSMGINDCKKALEETGGHQTKAADLLGVRQPYLARLIKNLGVPKP